MIKKINIIVKNLSKKRWKVVFKKDIYEIIDPELKPEYQAMTDKIIYQLRAQKYIRVLKNGVYIVPEIGEEELHDIELIDKYYYLLLKKYISENVGAEYYIGWGKALEFHMKDFSLSESLHIITKDTEKKIQMGEYELVFKTIVGKNSGKTMNLFPKLKPYIQEIQYENIKLKVACIELALLEAALIYSTEEWLQFELLSKAIKKYGKTLNHEIFYDIGKYKFSMSFNRLKEIAKPISPELSKVFLEVIKKNGGNFIGEGLRWF